MRLNMTLNWKIVLSAAGVAALLASPATAKERTREMPPSLINVPADAQASIRPNGSAVTVYSPDVKVQAHPINGLNPDFQLGSDK